MRATKPPVRDPWANAASGSPDIAEAPYVSTGWPAPSGDPIKPPRGYFNFEQNRLDNGLIYTLQRGLPDWDVTETDYAAGDILRYTDNRFWVCVGTPTPGLAPPLDLDNWQLWLASPIGAGNIPTWAWRNARGYSGSVINSQGIIGGRILTIEEDWTQGDDQGPGTATGPWFGRWNYGIFGDGGNVYASNPALSLSVAPWGPLAGVTILGGVFPFNQSAALIEMRRAIYRGGGSYVSFETAVSVNPSGAGTLEDSDTYSLGFSSGTLVGAAEVGPCGTGAMASNAGAFLAKGQGDTFWTALSRPVGGGGAGTATGLTIAANSPFRYGVEIIRADAAEDNANHVIHYINGDVVADHSVDMAGAALTPFIRSSGENQGPHVHSVLNVGRIVMQGRLEAGDV